MVHVFPLYCAKGLGARADDLPLTNGGEQRLKLSKSSRWGETGVGPRAPLASQLGRFSLGPKIFSLGPEAFSLFGPYIFGSKAFSPGSKVFSLGPKVFSLSPKVFFPWLQGFH